MAERLNWPDRWMSADRVIRPLGEMTTDHLWAVLGYLRWYGPELLTKGDAPVVILTQSARLGLPARRQRPLEVVDKTSGPALV